MRPTARRTAVPLAAACELVHTATLVHDDIIDSAETRRGRLTAHSRWGSDVTVLLGDYIVSQFLAARNWPFGSALSFAVMFVMLVATIFYFRMGAKTL